MTTNYTDVFGADTVPPSLYGYQALTLAATTSFNWPTSGTADLVSAIMDVTASAPALSMNLPPADETSPGQDLLIRNVGAEDFTVNGATGVAIGTVMAGSVIYVYVADNTSPAGTWGMVEFGVGTSNVDAATLVGYGIKAIGNTLNQSHPVLSTGAGVTVDVANRAQMINFTGGVDTIALTAAATLGDDFFTIIRNSGTGTLTINPYSTELIDGVSTFGLQPGESLLLFCSGSDWFTAGYGRSVVYNFTQLVKDVTAGGTFTLTPAEASNKLLTFIGSPGAGVTVIVPNVVAVYYLLNSLSTAQSVTVKTVAGTGVAVPQSQRVVAICDSTNVYSAQSVSASTSVALIDGSVASPSLNFSSQTNTGLYKYSSNGLGVAINGVDLSHFETTGTTFNGTSPVVSAKIGPTVAQQHTVPAVASDTVALLAATQALTNKTIVAASNTITTAASGTLAATNLNAALAELDSEKAPKASPTFTGTVAGISATMITNTPAGNIAATTVQAALAELDAEKPGENYVHNSDMLFSTRGASAVKTVSGYVLDRWEFIGDGTCSVTISQTALAAGEITGQRIAFAQYMTVGSASGQSFMGFAQGLENVRLFAGRTVTLSFWGISGTGKTISPEFQQNFGSGGSGTVKTTGTPITLTSSWARYSQTFTLPNISGKTLGTNPFLGLYLFTPINTTYSLAITGVKLELGSVATEYESPDIAVNYAQCRRFYEAGTVNAYNNSLSTATIGDNIRFTTPKAKTPNSVALAIGTVESISADGFRGYYNTSPSSWWSTTFTADSEFGL